MTDSVQENEAKGETVDVPSSQSAATGGAGQHNDDDIDAIINTCQRVSEIMTNFNSKRDSMPLEARECIAQLNAQLLTICKPVSSEQDISNLNSKPGSPETTSRRGKRKCNKKVKSESESSAFDSIEDHSSCANSSSTSEGESAQVNSERGLITTDCLLKILNRLDNRKVPKPDKFDADSGQSFSDFLKLFEQYCKCNFRGSSKLWVSELGYLLSGDLLNAFHALRVSGDSYSTIKEKLLQWRKDSLSVRSSDSKTKFTKAKPSATETTRLYAARLEKLYRVAYPNRNIDKSSTLRQKYIDSVPKLFRQQLSTYRNMIMTMNQSTLRWTDFLKLASCWDAENEIDCDPEPLLCLATASPTNFTDAVTQYNSPKPRGHINSSKPVYDSFKSRSRSSTRAAELRNITAGIGRYPRSTSMGRPGKTKCFYCHKLGHTKDNCWRLNNKCLACGSDKHRVKDCPKCHSLGARTMTPSFSKPLPRTPHPVNLKALV